MSMKAAVASLSTLTRSNVGVLGAACLTVIALSFTRPIHAFGRILPNNELRSRDSRNTRNSNLPATNSAATRASDDDEDNHAAGSTSSASLQRRRRETLEDEMEAAGGSLTTKPIGVVRSVYRLCVGTPRQGLLAPHARARIELNGLHDGAAAVDGLEQYSHVWIIFVFHLNTVGKRQQSKIAPPALGGTKVGVLATRSPHRFNPIGMTLAKLDRIHSMQLMVDGRKKGAITTVLEISGTDLVDGTPVLDIKPYVPTYDAPPGEMPCHVPEWVSEGLATARSVRLTENAENELKAILHDNPESSLEFYGAHHGDVSVDGTFAAITTCIREVLAMDVRSQYQTQKARRGQSHASRAHRMHPSTVPVMDSTSFNVCSQQLDNLLLYFTVQVTAAAEREESAGSGAEDTVVVQSIQLIGK